MKTTFKFNIGDEVEVTRRIPEVYLKKGERGVVKTQIEEYHTNAYVVYFSSKRPPFEFDDIYLEEDMMKHAIKLDHETKSKLGNLLDL